ncbi:hypothetical protein D9M72_557900 [compost metagenome]
MAEDVSTLADALVFDEPGASGDAHWNEEAKALIAGLVLKMLRWNLQGAVTSAHCVNISL